MAVRPRGSAPAPRDPLDEVLAEGPPSYLDDVPPPTDPDADWDAAAPARQAVLDSRAEAPLPLADEPLPAADGVTHVVVETLEGRASVPVPADPRIPSVDEPIILNGEVLGTPASLTAEGRSLYVANEMSSFQLGGLLNTIVDTRVPQAFGYEGLEGFRLYLQEKIGIGYRKARYLIGAYRYHAVMGTPEEVLQRIGWTKSCALVGLPEKDLPHGLIFAQEEGTTLEMLEDWARPLKGGRTRLGKPKDDQDPEQVPDERFQPMQLLLEKEDVDTVDTAIATMSQEAKVPKSKALSLIVTEWAMSKGYKVPIEKALERMEALYGVKVRIEQ